MITILISVMDKKGNDISVVRMKWTIGHPRLKPNTLWIPTQRSAYLCTGNEWRKCCTACFRYKYHYIISKIKTPASEKNYFNIII